MPEPAPQTTPSTPRSPRYSWVLLIFLLGLIVGRYAFPSTGPVVPTTFITAENGQRQLVFPTFWEAWDQLHTNFIGELDDKKLFYGAVEGMVRAAGDPYTTFANPEETKLLEESLQGSFSGVGIEIGLKNGLVTVIAPLEGTPAQRAGITEGDIIVAVNKEPLTQDTTIDQVVQKIRGPKGTHVTLTVISSNSSDTKDIDLVRDTISIASVKGDVADGIATIKITNFNSDTSNRFRAAIKDAVSQSARSVILDLRGNPGGYLTSAVDIASEFLEAGKVVVTEKGTEDKEYKSRRAGSVRTLPVVILVDGGSASASEIVAGALKDQKNTPIIGTKTFGKGSVQEVIDLQDGSSLKVTIAKWFTPNGTSINEQGIEPTIVVEQNRETDEDEPLQRAQEEIKKLINPS